MRLLLLLSVLATTASCTTPCEQLAHEICACEPGQTAIDSCNRRAADTASKVSPNQAQEDHCSTLIDGCDCHALSTPQGKIACGLAE